MGIKITGEAPDFDDFEKKLQRRLDAVGADVKDTIDKRTRSGRGIKGSFKPYTKSYAEYRVSKGRQKRPVNLTFTGKMLQNMTWKTYKAGSRITIEFFFSSATEATKAAANHKIRPWFGLSKREEGKFRDEIQKLLDEVIENA